jgi:hypothetical protein
LNQLGKGTTRYTRFEVDHPGDYATFNSYQPSDGTSGPPTNFSPFWRRSDYAAFFTAISVFQAGLAALIGIIRSAA